MAEDEPTGAPGVAVVERPESKPSATAEKQSKTEKKSKKDKKKSRDEDAEHEIEFSTPFGKLEFEFEPTSSKQKRDERKRQKQREDAEKAAANASKKQAKQRNRSDEAVVESAAKGGGMLLPMLIIFALIVGTIAVAFWLFARPGDDAESIPDQYRSPEMEPAIAEPQGFLAKAQQRIRHAVRAGKRASREAQEAQERRFQDLTSGG